MWRVGGAVGVGIVLFCAPVAAAREVQAEHLAHASAHGQSVRIERGKPADLVVDVRPYKSLAVRVRSSRCRGPARVFAVAAGQPSRFLTDRVWEWKTVLERPGVAGQLPLHLRVTTRQRRCSVLVDSVRVEERIELGTAMWTRHMDADPRYEATAEQAFGSITPENEMKMLFLQPERGEFDFSGADALVEWARARGKTVHGHTLVYGEQLPGWITRRDLFGRSVFTREEMLAVLENHVKTVVSRYRGHVASWDVVNEAISRDGKLRHNIFLEVIGPEYIELAFRWAREADPHARLFYNDAGAELDNKMSDAILEMLERLRADGVPIDGVGFQAHLDVGSPPGESALAENVARFAALGLDVAFAELDVATDPRPAGDPLAAQADVYRTVAGVCAAQPRCVRVTVWGVGDAVSWRGLQRAPLPFDAEYQPKPAWAALTGALG